jgi:hypothetical protein
LLLSQLSYNNLSSSGVTNPRRCARQTGKELGFRKWLRKHGLKVVPQE